MSKQNISYEPNIKYTQDYYAENDSAHSTTSETINPLGDYRLDTTTVPAIKDNMDYIDKAMYLLPTSVAKAIGEVYDPVKIIYEIIKDVIIDPNIDKPTFRYVFPEPVPEDKPKKPSDYPDEPGAKPIPDPIPNPIPNPDPDPDPNPDPDPGPVYEYLPPIVLTSINDDEDEYPPIVLTRIDDDDDDPGPGYEYLPPIILTHIDDDDDDPGPGYEYLPPIILTPTGDDDPEPGYEYLPPIILTHIDDDDPVPDYEYLPPIILTRIDDDDLEPGYEYLPPIVLTPTGDPIPEYLPPIMLTPIGPIPDPEYLPPIVLTSIDKPNPEYLPPIVLTPVDPSPDPKEYYPPIVLTRIDEDKPIGEDYPPIELFKIGSPIPPDPVPEGDLSPIELWSIDVSDEKDLKPIELQPINDIYREELLPIELLPIDSPPIYDKYYYPIELFASSIPDEYPSIELLPIKKDNDKNYTFMYPILLFPIQDNDDPDNKNKKPPIETGDDDDDDNTVIITPDPIGTNPDDDDPNNVVWRDDEDIKVERREIDYKDVTKREHYYLLSRAAKSYTDNLKDLLNNYAFCLIKCTADHKDDYLNVVNPIDFTSEETYTKCKHLLDISVKNENMVRIKLDFMRNTFPVQYTMRHLKSLLVTNDLRQRYTNIDYSKGGSKANANSDAFLKMVSLQYEQQYMATYENLIRYLKSSLTITEDILKSIQQDLLSKSTLFTKGGKK